MLKILVFLPGTDPDPRLIYNRTLFFKLFLALVAGLEPARPFGKVGNNHSQYHYAYTRPKTTF